MNELLIGGYLLGAGVTAFLAGAAIVDADDPNIPRAMLLVAIWPFTVLLVGGMMWWGERR